MDKIELFEHLHSIFGDTLPTKDVFFATEGVPTRAPLFNAVQDWNWNNFVIKYNAFVASKQVKTVTAPRMGAAKSANVRGTNNV
jgi:hypothetical protein